MATARWLVARGARHLALIGRSGAASAEAAQALDDFKAAGVNVHAASLDVADGGAVKALFSNDWPHHGPPSAGVIHAAMVLDDAVIANLDAERL